MTRSVRIALARPVRKLFDYQTPESLSLTAGQRVRIPFGRQIATGVVAEVDAHPPPGITLKTVQSAYEHWPALPPETLSLLTWAANYYQHPLGECLFMAMPPPLRKGRPAERATKTHWQLIENTLANLPANAVRLKALIDWLSTQTTPRETSAITQAGFTRAQLTSLANKGLVSATDQAMPPQPSEAPFALPTLSGAQTEAFDQLPSPELGFSASLLYGITGSGKTEIYLHYLQKYLPHHQQALVLVPEINLTPQTVSRFRRYSGSDIVVWHSSLNDSERLDTWLRIREGEPVTVIGTRSAALLPFTHLGTIIVDEEHDSSYKQGEGFRYSGRDLAVYRARLNQCPIILGSATPSLESLHNARSGKYRLIKLEERAGNAQPPTIKLLDIRSRPLEGGLAAPALKAVRDCLESGQQALVFVNRRGFAPVMMCFDCGHMVECPRCDTRLTYHRKDRAMRCHHCEFQMAATEQCPQCQSHAFKPVGQGTERTEDILTQQFPDTPVIRVDRDSTQRKGSIQSILKTVNTGQPCVLVGTQMLAKGHDFPNVTLVIVVNADGGLFSVDFRAPEQLIQTLLQVSGRAGRGELAGQVIVQTCHSDHPMLRQLADGHYLPLADHMVEERATGGFPPFRAMAILRADSSTMEASIDFLDRAKELLKAQPLDVWGPLPAVIARRADRHRAQLTILCDSKSRLNRALSSLCQALESQKTSNQLRWHVDVDPLETG
ncbi:primosomal protein N' [Marinobacter caseinilyticus]|uniref:primosomal protein N' n=1 Tax=Marinobacter caseinilyticus TaxID=2692195 RepID=UPI00140E65B9|nr:primosomal protein N' [Marinobacter caseinilyticus]